MEVNRYESDRSLKEKLYLEWQKLKSLTWKKRLVYMATYYKWYAVFILVVCFTVYVFGYMIYSSQFDTVFAAYIINGFTDGDPIAEDFKEYCEDTEKYHKYTVNASLRLTGTNSDDYDTLGTLLGTIASEDVHVIILPEFQLERYVEQGAFYTIEEILTDEQIETYGELVSEYALKVSNNEKLAEFGCHTGEDAYLAVFTYVEDLTYVQNFIEYLMED